MPSAQNWLLLLAYDGTCYHGWQVQPNSPSIQETLEQAITSLTGETVKVNGAGRTDSGVHALNFTVNFSAVANNFKTAEKWRVALNAVLPPDIVVKYAQKVSADFHARHNAVGKRYRYLISNQPYQSPFSLNQSWWVSHSLDIKLMREAAGLLVGKHDFSAFRAASCSSPSPLKDLREITISKVRSRYSTLQIEMEANSFLQHMVRIIAGTLVEVGRGHKSVKDVAVALESGLRKQAGITAPGHGLYSLSVIYPEGLIKWPPEVLDN
ncbi:MAG: tRNA pseudouridine(38-40) synthase TruA [SAR324 cluster bacterium]|nr:tRNA pseudouridine(38-40) synthase TruA [SAR324 cluster bacterium]MBL7035775.1 tRNA pseudouridine(38-40) synthase TruA [SAR324 cluster bacterium]